MSFYWFLLMTGVSATCPIMLATWILACAFWVGWGLGLYVSKWFFVSIAMIFLGGMMVVLFYIISLSEPYLKMDASVGDANLTMALLVGCWAFDTNINQTKSSLGEIFSITSVQAVITIGSLLFACLLIVVKLAESFKGSLVNQW